tara:strand:- start:207 stop:722 length:516 start_codon:yes stop_codon:yes gene_type:complete
MVEEDMSTESIAVYPGSFDPVTRGHLEIIERARDLFDVLHVAVVANPSKECFFSSEERLDLLRTETAALGGRGRLEFSAFEGLTVQLAGKLGARWIVRGLRSGADLGYELPMALTNRDCAEGEIDTVFLPAGPGTSFISSSLVREIAAAGGRLDSLVTGGVEEALRKKSAS